jgi:SAM-dependent methyltransferase
MSEASTVAITEKESAALFVLELSMAYTYSAGLRAVTCLGVADHLVDGPKTAEELARATDTHPRKLYRVLRLLAARGVFREGSDGRFELTPAADVLRTDAPQSLRAAIRMITDRTFWAPTADIVENLRGAEGGVFERMFGTTFFNYWSKGMAPEEDFHVGMASMSDVENKFLTRGYEFPDGATVVDVGGGRGGLLLLVLQENPGLRGILFDQEHVVAKSRLAELGDESRWQLVAGDFFDKCPQGDVYLLKYIMHNWADDQAVRILRNCREAMAPGGRVLVCDPVIPPGNTPHTGKLMDLVVMSIYSGGCERTKEEFGRLFADAGLRLSRVIDTGSHVSIVEAVAA